MPRAKNARRFLFAAALAVVSTLSIAAAGQQEDASALLRASIEAPRHLSYSGQVETVQFGTSKSEATIYRIEHNAPDLTRRWYVAPQALYGDWIVTRGQQSFNVDVKNRRIVLSKNAVINDQFALDDNLGLLNANYRTVLGPGETIAGRPCAAVILLNHYTGQVVMRLWIDKATHLLLQRENYAGNGSVTHQTRFDQIRYTSALPAAIFAKPELSGFETVKGLDHGSVSNDLEHVVRTAGFSAHGPKYLPDGFVPIAGDVSDIKGVRTLHLLYSDGIRTLSLFENNRGAAADLGHYTVRKARVADHDAQYVEDGPTRLLAWRADSGFHYALVGELSRKELEKIAASVEPAQ